jgi:hypothetical protein
MGTSDQPESPRLNHIGELGRCLVTGGAGFLGRNLVKALLAGGCGSARSSTAHRSLWTIPI